MRYWNDEAATRALDRGGWKCTGDLARRDQDGYFWFEGRSDDIIKSSGYRIGPFEIESVMLEHGAAAEVAVVGVPDPVRGQAVKAFVVTRPGIEPSQQLAEEIIEFTRHIADGINRHAKFNSWNRSRKPTPAKFQSFLLRKSRRTTKYHDDLSAPCSKSQLAEVVYVLTGRAGWNMIFLSGTTATDDKGRMVGKGDIVAQTRHIFRKFAAVLEVAGGGLANIVETTDYVLSLEDYQKTAEVRRELLNGPPWPAATGVVVSGLVRPDALIEIKGIAVLSG